MYLSSGSRKIPVFYDSLLVMILFYFILFTRRGPSRIPWIIKMGTLLFSFFLLFFFCLFFLPGVGHPGPLDYQNGCLIIFLSANHGCAQEKKRKKLSDHSIIRNSFFGRTCRRVRTVHVHVVSHSKIRKF